MSKHDATAGQDPIVLSSCLQILQNRILGQGSHFDPNFLHSHGFELSTMSLFAPDDSHALQALPSVGSMMESLLSAALLSPRARRATLINQQVGRRFAFVSSL